jgi:hypothetical protein
MTVEDKFHMKKYSPLIALMLLASGVTLAPLRANAQDDDKMVAFERDWYDTCYQKKDNEKCYQQSKELLDKFPASKYRPNAEKNVKSYDRNKASEKFQAALDAYYKQSPQDAAKLEALFAAGDGYLQAEPDQQSPSHLYVLGQMALAGHQASLGRVYDKLDKVKDYVDRAMKTFVSAQPSEATKKDFELYVVPLKDLLAANGNQFLGFRLIETKGDQNQALDYLGQAIQVKGKEVGWKDPINYWLRAMVYNNQYTELRKQYDALPTDADKTGDPGKELLNKVNALLDTKLVPEYARVLATANKPDAKNIYDAAKQPFDQLWEYRTGAKDKADDYIKNYANDPTVNSVPIPAKPADASSLNAPAPPTGPANVKLPTGKPSAAPGGKATNGNGAKSAPAKGKAKPKGRRRN